MLQEFETYLTSNADFPEEVIKAMYDLAIVKTLKRNESLLQAGDVCRYKVFIAKGLLRCYVTGGNGNEHILQFCPENSWTLDVESYDNQIPATTNIAAIEPSVVLLWTKNDFEKLRTDFPLLKQFSEILISRSIYQNRQRVATTLSATPEEKYEDFVSKHPSLLSRLPLHMIAAYLGISLKTLTRIRHSQLNR
ncbi:MAG: cyclic nucleotide-binding protein [Flavobacterium psychrophilum]|nr:MAG: cyclic nucleotide-binding protein [Flavobacterium psychrophilum]